MKYKSTRFWTKNRPFNWKHWDEFESQYSGSQKERWHLNGVHHKQTLQLLVDWLSEACEIKWKTRPNISADSVWVDAKPQAFFTNTYTKQIDNVELADLLLVLKKDYVIDGIRKTERRAILLQGKCVDAPMLLDTCTCSYGNESSQRERDLLEESNGLIELYESYAKNKQIGCSGYNLHSNNNMKKSLGDFARYLNIPKLKPKSLIPWGGTLPYQTLWPSSRNQRGGTNCHFAEFILNMSGASKVSNINSYGRETTGEWGRLVNDIVDWSNSAKKVNRFGGITVRNSAQSSNLSCAKVLETIYNLLHKYIIFTRIIMPNIYKCFLVPDRNDNNGIPPVTSEAGGFVVLQIYIE